MIGIAVTTAGTPLQLLSGYLLGLEVTRGEHKNFCKAALFPAVIRCLYYCAAIGWLILFEIGSAGFGLFFITNCAFIAALVWRIKAVEALMPYGYLERVGYLTAGGYGVLPGIDNPILAAGGSGGGGAVEESVDLPHPHPPPPPFPSPPSQHRNDRGVGRGRR